MQTKLHISQWLLYLLAMIILGVIFLSYFAPDLMFAITNSIWAMCGW
jgi:hypothetical protein